MCTIAPAIKNVLLTILHLGSDETSCYCSYGGSAKGPYLVTRLQNTARPIQTTLMSATDGSLETQFEHFCHVMSIHLILTDFTQLHFAVNVTEASKSTL